MKHKKHVVINALISVVLLGIVVNQIIWLQNMYSLAERELKANANQSLQNAAYMELNERSEIMGGFTVFSSNLSTPNDTSRFFSKDVVTADSTYTFILDKNDQNTMHKISQFVLKQIFPIRLERLDTLFKENMDGRYAVQETYFDYLDLEMNTLLSTSRPINIKPTHYILTDTFSLDIANSIGIVAYVKNSRTAILDTMKKQLSLSVLLIIIGIVSLYYISRSFVFQWKTEKMRQESVNVMTHEFKRPISSAVAMVSTIPFYLKKKETDKVLDYVNNIEIALNKLTYYTKRIQQISNNERNSVILEKATVQIVPFFESLRQRYVSPEEHGGRIILNVEFKTSKKVMDVDPLHFSNVMDNLVENAIKYTVITPVMINIDVTDSMNDKLKISVTDNGIGISTPDIKHIFDKFYRVKRTETKNKIGFGLGLTYVKSIVEAHGGTISVSSELNKGSEFILIFQG